MILVDDRVFGEVGSMAIEASWKWQLEKYCKIICTYNQIVHNSGLFRNGLKVETFTKTTETMSGTT